MTLHEALKRRARRMLHEWFRPRVDRGDEAGDTLCNPTQMPVISSCPVSGVRPLGCLSCGATTIFAAARTPAFGTVRKNLDSNGDVLWEQISTFCVRRSQKSCKEPPTAEVVTPCFYCGADGGTRTRTLLRTRDFKSRVSTGSTTSAPGNDPPGRCYAMPAQVAQRSCHAEGVRERSGRRSAERSCCSVMRAPACAVPNSSGNQQVQRDRVQHVPQRVRPPHATHHARQAAHLEIDGAERE